MIELNYLTKLLDGDSVEWMSLGEIAEYSTTRVDAIKLDATSFTGVDNLISNKGGRIDANYLPNTARLTAYEPGDILLGNIRPYLKKVWMATNSGGCSGDVLAVRIRYECRSFVNPNFLYFILSSDAFFSYSMQHAKGAKMPRGSKADILNYEIPIPCPSSPEKSLAIQSEIVRILDKFTALTTELTTELTARKKQYNYYCDQLLNFDENIPVVPLSDCCVSISDGDHQAPPKTDSGVPFITISNITRSNTIDFENTHFVADDYYQRIHDKRRARKKDILYTAVGSIGIPVYIDFDMKFAFQRHIAILRADEQKIMPKYLYHVMRSSAFFKKANSVAVGAAQKTITLSALNKMNVHIPPIGEQERIVNILDKFDTLANSLSEGLPREIELHQKQYEYYRDLLFTFPKLNIQVEA